jgi:hypothetical protein
MAELANKYKSLHYLEFSALAIIFSKNTDSLLVDNELAALEVTAITICTTGG